MTKIAKRNKRKLSIAFKDMDDTILNTMGHVRRSVGRTMSWHFS